MLDGDAGDNNAQREAQLKLLLDLLASFLFTSTGDRPFSSGLVHFLAVLGIDSDTNRLRTAKNYSYMLAGVVYCKRVLSVEHLLPSASRDEQTDEDRERFLQHREKYLADDPYSPMSEALSLLAYGKSVALAAGNAGNAYWSKDKKIFYLHGRPIYISRFRTMAQNIVTEAQQRLWCKGLRKGYRMLMLSITYSTTELANPPSRPLFFTPKKSLSWRYYLNSHII
jgi:hypothetical protein